MEYKLFWCEEGHICNLSYVLLHYEEIYMKKSTHGHVTADTMNILKDSNDKFKYMEKVVEKEMSRN